MATSTQPKPQNDAYTGILFISLLALIGACVLLYMDYEQYGARTPTKGAQLEIPTKSLDRPAFSPTIPAGGGNAPVAEPKKAPEPTMMKPAPMKARDTEVTSVRPMIQAPPATPAQIPALEVPGVGPAPVVTRDEIKVQPAKFETLAPVPAVVDVTPVEPMRDLTTHPLLSKPVQSAPAVVPANPSLEDAPPVVRPFVPEK